MSRILVTGGAGFIGSHTAKQLSRAGHTPIVFDNLSTGHEWAVQWGPFVKGDLCDGDLIKITLREFEIEAVIHFAASAYVGDSVVRPRHYFQNNVSNSLNLLDAMLDTGVRHVVFSSSCATYGTPEHLPIREDHSQHPLSPYGESKYFVERVMRAYSNAYDLTCCALRYFNAAGADPEGELGEVHDPETHLIPSVFEVAIGFRPSIPIYGSDYPTHDGTCVRDYIHVCDLADAHVRAVEYLIDGGNCTALNLGNGHGYSVNEIVQVVEGVSDMAIPVSYQDRRPGDASALIADSTLARQVLGWKPKYADIEQIVADAWRWQVALANGAAVRQKTNSPSPSAMAADSPML